MVAKTFPLFTKVPSNTKISLTVPPISVATLAEFCGGTVVYPFAFITVLRLRFSIAPNSTPTVLNCAAVSATSFSDFSSS